MPWTRLESSDPHEAVWEIQGNFIRNGESDANTYASTELVSNLDACLKPDQFMADLRFDGGKIVG